MKKKSKVKRPTPIAIRPNESDLEIMRALGEKLGLGPTHVIRVALRRLADHELIKRAS